MSKGVLAPLEQHWSVEVTRNGESLIVIESNHMAGKVEFSPAEEQTIRDAAEHLRSFIGLTALPGLGGPQEAPSVEDIAVFIEHVRDHHWSTLESVTDVARLVRQRFGVGW